MMISCPNCDAAGWQLWMDRGKPRFVRCFVCVGEKTITWLIGAAPMPPLASDIKLTRRSNKWMSP